MQVRHRRSHRLAWAALTLLVGFGFIAAIALRQPTPIEETVFTPEAGAGQ